MENCEFIDKCLFFNDKLKNMPKASESLKNMYCRWHHGKCARYKIAITLGKSAVPEDLYPGDIKRAGDILIQYDIK
jgi:hypothetical protein